MMPEALAAIEARADTGWPTNAGWDERLELMAEAFNDRAALLEALRGSEADNARLRAEVQSRSGPCHCDPSGSGEEYCHDTCTLQADNARLRDALEEIARNGSALCSRAPVIAQAVLKPAVDEEPNPFGQRECRCCGWANHDVRKTCRNCDAALDEPSAE